MTLLDMQKITIVAITAFFLFSSASSLAYTSPGKPLGLISDFADMMSAQTRDTLEQTLRAYEQKTGRQIAVATINELGDETVETYTVRLFQEWGIGQKGKDNGALFLISKNDREMRIEVGYGLEGELTDIESKKIIDDVAAPYFKSNDFDGGVSAAVKSILAAIDSQGEEVAVASSQSNRGRGLNWEYVFWMGIGLFMWLTTILARSRSWWLGGVIGGVAGVVIWLMWAMWFSVPILIFLGLLFDYLVSRKYQQASASGNFSGLWWLGGGRHRWDKGSGWGGFGGGMSGGGGASGRW